MPSVPSKHDVTIDSFANQKPAQLDPTVRALDQANLFWHHKWSDAADTRVYTGIAAEPGEWVVGADGQVALTACWSLFGGFHFVLPSAGAGDLGSQEEIWNVSAGVAYYPGGNAQSRSVCGRRWMPLLPVADNGSFALGIR